MVMLLLDDVEPADDWSAAIGLPTTVVESPLRLRRLLEAGQETELVVIGPDIDLQLVLDLCNDERVRHPALGFVLLRKRIDSAVLTKALQAGVREVVPADKPELLGEACERSLELSDRMTQASAAPDATSAAVAGQVITVFAAKGGCGKTTVATNLAAALADHGRRRVCLVDIDLAFGDVGIALQLPPTRTIADAVHLGRLDPTAVESLVLSHTPGLDVIVAPTEPGVVESVTADLISDLLHVLRSMYDYVVIDCPPAMTDHVLVAFDQSDRFVLLATLDVPAVKNLKLALETLDLLGYPRDRWLTVINRADSKVGLSVADVARTLTCEIAAEVPSSRAVPAAVNRGVALVLESPGHPVSVAVGQLAQRIVGSGGTRARATVRTGAAHVAPRRGMSLLRRRGAEA
jgi:pilus assembly protein CpaE